MTGLTTKGLSKSERIVSRKLIEGLFTSGRGHSLTAFPLRAVYMVLDRLAEAGTQCEPPVTLLLSVPKRKFKHAVDRNRVKRQLREAYRTHKHLLTAAVPEGHQVALALVWLSDRHFASADVEHRVCSLLTRIASALNPA
ncbi:MAG: ribonuclease P protein component [Prevotella sp.]|nr:ribonuclease P protein component [Prevotella sp.]MBR3066183.1 ribonuclease P protein component [Prevotella sp.]MBR6997388.1 ribonuclease P protein component [Prevotella sp.]